MAHVKTQRTGSLCDKISKIGLEKGAVEVEGGVEISLLLLDGATLQLLQPLLPPLMPLLPLLLLRSEMYQG